MAHVHHFGEVAPAAAGIIHLGATSEDIGGNTDLLLLRQSLQLIVQRLAGVIDDIATFGEKHRDVAALGQTHLQAAQPTTVGKRAMLWCQDFILCLEELEYRLANFRLRGLRGATGTQASFLELFKGDAAKVKELERRFLEKIGAQQAFPITGQVYPRIADSQIVGSIGRLAEAAMKMFNDVRILAHDSEMSEPMSPDQIGSSAMAYKRNPARSERGTGISRVLMSQPHIAAQTSVGQFLERTLDDSASRRFTLPESCLAADSVLLIARNVAQGLEIYPHMIDRNLRRVLPFFATENILMRATDKGGDRQQLHEAIRRHSLATRDRMLAGGDNDLLDRLKGDALFANVDVEAATDPKLFVGLAPEQVAMFVAEYVAPIRTRYASTLGRQVELKV